MNPEGAGIYCRQGDHERCAMACQCECHRHWPETIDELRAAALGDARGWFAKEQEDDRQRDRERPWHERWDNDKNYGDEERA